MSTTVTAPPAAGLETADAEALSAFLRDRDIPCPLCRYNLRHLSSPRCPECGRELELRVGLSEPRQGAWLLCQIALTAPAGIGLVAVPITFKDGWPQNTSVQWLFNICFAWFMGSVPFAAAVFWLRRRYLRLPRGVQWGFAIAAAVLAVGTIAGIVVAN
jgi:uncharacterized paraquat-inducible protein A